MKKNPKDDMKKSIIDNARRDEIKDLVKQSLKSQYYYFFVREDSDFEKIITSWWLYLFWYDKKNGNDIRFPNLINFRIKNRDKVIKYSFRCYDDYLDIEL